MAKTPARSPIPPERIEHYDRLIASEPGVERKGATVPYTALNGHMFSYLTGAGSLALRLGPADREAFVSRYDASLQEAYGIVQKEYVSVPDALLGDPDELRPWFRKSYAYVAGLKPKPTTRPKKG